MNKVIEKLKQIGVIPLAVFKDEKQAVPVANALSKARIDTLEVTLRTEKGVKAIEEIKKTLGQAITIDFSSLIHLKHFEILDDIK